MYIPLILDCFIRILITYQLSIIKVMGSVDSSHED